MVKNKVKFIKFWECKPEEDNDYQIIRLGEKIQLPTCYLFHVYGDIEADLCFLTEIGGIGNWAAYIEDDFLYAGFASNVIIYDLNNKNLINNIHCKEWIHNFFKLDNGFLLHQEMSVKFFNKNLDLLWEDTSCVNIFGNLVLKENYEIGKDYIAIIDWYGFKHYYNKNGQFKMEKTEFDSGRIVGSTPNCIVF